MVKVGEVVENFVAEAFFENEIKKISLSNYRGKWVVLLFYPADFTFVCPTELEEAADLHAEFKKENAEILSVSTDTAFVHKAWHNSSPAIGKIKYPMVADPSGKICKQFGTYLPDEGVSLRGSFIIDPEGVLKAIDVHDNSIGRSSSEILRKLQASKFVSENEGLVCPAGWKPGGKTLKPGLDLVGKL